MQKQKIINKLKINNLNKFVLKNIITFSGNDIFKLISKTFYKLNIEYFPKKITINDEYDYSSYNNLLKNYKPLIKSMIYNYEKIQNIDYLSIYLKHIKLPFNFCDNLKSLEYIEIFEIYGKNINNDTIYIPSSVKKLKISCDIGETINMLPNSIEELILEDGFTQIIRDYPKYLKKLIFNTNYKYTINISNTVEVLKLPSNEFDIIIPEENNVQTLMSGNLNENDYCKFKKIKKMYTYNIYNVLLIDRLYNVFNNNLVILVIDNDLFNTSVDFLPQSLIKLYIKSTKFYYHLHHLPKSLLELYIISYFFDSRLDNLPENLETLVIKSSCFKNSLNNLPHNLKNLVLDLKYPVELSNPPKNLELLSINQDFNTNLLFKDFNHVYEISI